MKLAIFFIAAFLILQCIPESEAGIGKKANKALEKFKSLKDKLKEKIGHLKNECQKFFKKAKEGIKNSIVKIKKEIDETGDSAVKVIFRNIYEGLDKARKKLNDVAEIADKKFYEAMKKAHEMFFSVTSQIEKFNEKLRKMIEKKQAKEKGLEILDQFVDKSSEKVGSCSDGALNPIKKLYEDTKDIIKASVDKLEAIIRQCEVCLTGKKSEILTCGKELLSTAGDQIYKLVGEVMKLKDKLVGGAVKELLNLGCVAKTRAAVEFDKLSVEKKIKDLK